MAKLVPDVTPQDYQIGPADATVTLVEFGDYQCPFCAEANIVVKALLVQFGNKLRYAFRDFPLQRAHPEASAAANFAGYANTRGKYWEAHNALFENQDQLGTDYYQKLAKDLGFPVKEALDAVEMGYCNKRIQESTDSGSQSKIMGTPAFFLNGQTLEVRFTQEAMAAAIQTLLTRK